MKFQKRILIITIIVGVILISIFFAVTNAITKYTGFSVVDADNSFEKCLREQEITLYINTYNSVETLRGFDMDLKEYFKDIKIVNCVRDNKICLEKGINSFPSWMIKNEKIEKGIDIKKLSEFSGCRLSK